MVWPLSMPAGMVALMVLRLRTAPLPRQSVQGWWMMRPLPPHLGQGEDVANTPMGVCRRTWTVPVPWQSGHTDSQRNFATRAMPFSSFAFASAFLTVFTAL